MSQEASTPSTLTHDRRALAPAWSGEAGSRAKPARFSADAYADRLMDELFEDVERSLDLSGNLPEAQVVPSPVVEEPLPELVSSPAAPLVVQSAPPLEPVWEEPEAVEPEPEAAPPVVRQSGRAYDRLLLGLACVATIAALVVWLLWREVKQPAIVAAPQATASPLNPADMQFADYAKQALQALGNQAPSPDRRPLPSPTASVPALPGVTVPKAPTAQTTGGVGAVSALPSPMPPTVVVPGMTASPRPSVASPATVRSPEPAPSPTVARTLVGVLELGDRSAALVEIAGVVQRFRIGESISASGWTLVEVSKNQAVIRRNGEVRSIFIGQAF